MSLHDSPLKLGTKVHTAIYTASDEPVCVVDSMQERVDDYSAARRHQHRDPGGNARPLLWRGVCSA
jgi:hypothetical protein